MPEKPLKPLTRKEEKRIRKEFNDARNIKNSNCEKRGEELVKEAIAFHSKKKESSKKNSDEIAKDVAHYAVGIARGRIMTSGNGYCCFDCVNHISNDPEKEFRTENPCVSCQNGALFQEVLKEELSNA